MCANLLKVKKYLKNQKILSHTNHYTVRRNLTLEVQTLPVNPLSTTQRHDSRRKITTPTTKNRRTHFSKLHEQDTTTNLRNYDTFQQHPFKQQLRRNVAKMIVWNASPNSKITPIVH